MLSGRGGEVQLDRCAGRDVRGMVDCDVRSAGGRRAPVDVRERLLVFLFGSAGGLLAERRTARQENTQERGPGNTPGGLSGRAKALDWPLPGCTATSPLDNPAQAQ